MTSPEPPAAGCACGRIDVHAHFLPECYLAALKTAGMETLDGGFPIPAWSGEAAVAMMDRRGIETAMISLSSPSTHFLPVDQKPRLVREVNEAGAALVREHPGRFGFFASLPLPDAAAALAEIAHAFDRLGADGVVLETNISARPVSRPSSTSLSGAAPWCFCTRPVRPVSRRSAWAVPRRCWNFPSIRRGPSSTSSMRVRCRPARTSR
jgi:hypothetical protein